MPEYHNSILYMINELRDKRPLPAHLDYQVGLRNKLTEPRLGLFIIPMEGLQPGQEAAAGLEFELDRTMPLDRQITSLTDAILRDKRFDIRDQLPEGTVQ